MATTIPNWAKTAILIGTMGAFTAAGLRLYFYYFGKNTEDKEALY